MNFRRIWKDSRPASRIIRLLSGGVILILLVLLLAIMGNNFSEGGRPGANIIHYRLPSGLGKVMPRGVLWGAYAGWKEDDVKAFEDRVGKKVDMEMEFAHFGNDPDFPMQYGTRVRDQGETLILFWEALDYNRNEMEQPEYSLDAILRGDHDAYLKHFADGAKAYGGPIILIPFSEMNGNWFPWGGTVKENNAKKYIDAYRYVRAFFRDVPNVKFGWAVNARDIPNTSENRFENYYPGGDYVDAVGVDGFDFGADEARSFDQLFNDPLSRLKTYKKPIYIFSMASGADPHKPLWITDALTVQLYRHPEVVGWLWFNSEKERDWRVDRDPATLNAFSGALGVPLATSTEEVGQ